MQIHRAGLRSYCASILADLSAQLQGRIAFFGLTYTFGKPSYELRPSWSTLNAGVNDAWSGPRPSSPPLGGLIETQRALIRHVTLVPESFGVALRRKGR